MKKEKKKKSYKQLRAVWYLFVFLSAIVPLVATRAIEPLKSSDDGLYSQLKGLIVLKVESRGEAYYVHPTLKNIYYLGRPHDAFAIMREQGVGITNANLAKIPVGSGINTLKGSTDLNFANKYAGYIFLQVESAGEAWYVYPKDKKRYYLGRPNDAFDIMRSLGLGISNVNFDKFIGNQETSVLGSNVGYSVDELVFTDSEGPHTIAVPFWYPTEAKPTSYTYESVGGDLLLHKYTSSIAQNATIASGRHPLILFFHGGLTCGTQSLFLTEHLASQGFIVAAPDFPDNISICSSKGGISSPLRTTLQELSIFKTSTYQEMLDMYEKNKRLPGASAILDSLLALNTTETSVFYNKIDQSKIGVIGHSYGGGTVVGIIGGYPNVLMHDKRVKAGVALSEAVFPFQETSAWINTPVMIMQGDDGDDFDQHDILRKTVYDKASGEKYFIKIKDGTHGSFFNGICDGYTTISACRNSNNTVKAINTYSSAFFKKYVMNDASADTTLSKSDSIFKVYLKP